MHTPHSHQSRPIFLLNGRSPVFTHLCSSGSTTALLGAELRRAHWLTSIQLEYPRTHGYHWWSKSYRHLAAESVLASVRRQSGIEPPDIIAHSMGCDMVREMLELTGAEEFRRIVLIAPAMSHRYDWTQHQFERMLVMRNPGDRAIWWGAMLPVHRFGWAGRRGFRRMDDRMTEAIVTDDERADRWGHSHYFRGVAVADVASLIDDFLSAG